MIDDPEDTRALRAALVRELTQDVRDPRVLDALGRVPRHLFVPSSSHRQAYVNHPLPIGFDQTISQPAIVGIMTEALKLRGGERILEIGTGSGYQAAILSLLAKEVYSVEVVSELAQRAKERLRTLGYDNVHVRAGDGYAGWPEHAPFDRVIVTAAPEELPRALFDQLDDGGILVAPIGLDPWSQRLYRYVKRDGTATREDLGGVRFVPMVPGD